MKRKKSILLLFFGCVLTLSIILILPNSATAQSIPPVKISKIKFISEDGKILQAIKTDQTFNVIILVEKETLGSEWTPFWLDIYVDDKRYASWGTGVYQGFVVYSTHHVSFNYAESGEHSVKAELFERIGDTKGDLLEIKTVHFKVRGK